MSQEKQTSEPNFNQYVEIFKNSITAIFSEMSPFEIIKEIPKKIELINELIDDFVRKHFEDKVANLTETNSVQASEQIAELEKNYKYLDEVLNEIINNWSFGVRIAAQKFINIETYKNRAKAAIQQLRTKFSIDIPVTLSTTSSINMPLSFKDVGEYFDFLGKIQDVDKDLDKLHQKYFKLLRNSNESLEDINQAYDTYHQLKLRLSESKYHIEGHPSIDMGFLDLFWFNKSNFLSRLYAYFWGITIINQEYLKTKEDKRYLQFEKDINSEMIIIVKRVLKTSTIDSEQTFLKDLIKNPDSITVPNLDAFPESLRENKDVLKLVQLNLHLEGMKPQTKASPTPESPEQDHTQTFQDLKKVAQELKDIYGKGTALLRSKRSGTLEDFFKNICKMTDITQLEDLSAIEFKPKAQGGVFRVGSDDTLEKLNDPKSAGMNEDEQESTKKKVEEFKRLVLSLQDAITENNHDIFKKLNLSRTVSPVSQAPIVPLIIQEKISKELNPLISDINNIMMQEPGNRRFNIAEKISQYLCSTTPPLNSSTIENLIKLLEAQDNGLEMTEKRRSIILENLQKLQSLFKDKGLELYLNKICSQIDYAIKDPENHVTQHIHNIMTSIILGDAGMAIECNEKLKTQMNTIKQAPACAKKINAFTEAIDNKFSITGRFRKML